MSFLKKCYFTMLIIKMNNELLLLIKKRTDTLIVQTKTKPQETLELKMNKQMQTFSFNPPINLIQGCRWLLAVSTLECINSIFNINEENIYFSMIISGHYQNEFAEKVNNDLNKLIELRSLELHAQEVRRRGNKIKTGGNDYKLSDFHTQKNDILEELGNVKYNDLKDMVDRMQLTYNEILDILDLEYIPSQTEGYSLNPGIHEVVDLNNTLKRIFLDNVKVSLIIDDIRLKSNLKTNQT